VGERERWGRDERRRAQREGREKEEALVSSPALISFAIVLTCSHHTNLQPPY
jgi:hypothetical protein